MSGGLSIGFGMLLFPLIYVGAVRLYQGSFQKEENKKRIPLHSPMEISAVLAGEAALLRIWFCLGKCSFENITFVFLYIMLAGMLVLCMMDFWEKTVPNRILLLLVMIWILLAGFGALRDLAGFYAMLPSVILGVIFCAVSFGICYIAGRGSLGAGDVKLTVVMGLYLTGHYVVGAVLYGCIAGAITSVLLLAAKKIGRKDTIPFVPFLYLGVVIRYLAG